MDRYDEVITQLKLTNVVFTDGLKPHEISEIENYYNFSFPFELKEFYSKTLPISRGFYNWRDKSDENLNMLKFMLDNPISEIAQDLRDGFIWCEEWGKKPENYEDSKRLMMVYYEKAPKLVPIYFHRYIPSMGESERLQTFSVHGSDTIYYGRDLTSYLEREFGLRKSEDVDDDQYTYVPFWSDLI